MNNKKHVHFKNYWLESTEANLKFFRPQQTFLLNNGRVYSQKQIKPESGEITDKTGSEERALLMAKWPGLMRMKVIQYIDNIRFILKYRFLKYQRKSYWDIYQEHQQVSSQIITMLDRINERTKARYEEAGITHSEQKTFPEDDAVRIALRAALKLRK